MNIVSIAIKQIKHTIRDKRALIFMLAFPLVLMVILGTALSNAFDNKIAIENIHVLYKNSASPPLSSSFEAFAKGVSKSGVHFKKVSSAAKGKKEVKDTHYAAFVELTNKGLQLYGNNRNSIEESIVQGMLTAFADKYNVTAAVASVDAKEVRTDMISNPHNFIKERSVNSAKRPGSMDYYAMAMTTMIALYGAMNASSLIRAERARNTSLRLTAAPIRKSEIFLGKILGCITINTLCLLAVIAFSHFVFKANWGNHIGTVLLVLITEVILAVSFGLGISFIAKTGDSANMILMLVVQLASFFGGAYFKIENPTGILNFVSNLSPLTWANKGLTKIIYGNDLSAAIPVISLNLGIAAVFLVIAIFSLRRREGL